MNIWLRNGLRRQGLSEFFFESDEPGFDELSPAAFLRRFPQGIYDIEGITLEQIVRAGRLSAGEAAHIGQELCRALAATNGSAKLSLMSATSSQARL